MATTDIFDGFDTKSIRMEALWTISFQAPEEDIDRVMAHVTKVAPLQMGLKYDSCAYQSANGFERYRPLEGAAAGGEEDVRKRPGVAEISFQISRDRQLLDLVIEAIFAVHSYEEPVIAVHETVVSRSKGLDDRDNPHRWWNKGGDWKETAG